MENSKLGRVPSAIEVHISRLLALQISTSEFMEFLGREKERLRGVLKSVREAVEDKSLDPDARSMITAEADSGIMGIESLIDAASYLEGYADSRNPEILETGRVMARRGQELVCKAAEMNMKSVETLHASVSDMAGGPSDPFTAGMISIY